jgi:hypothetical protein
VFDRQAWHADREVVQALFDADAAGAPVRVHKVRVAGRFSSLPESNSARRPLCTLSMPFTGAAEEHLLLTAEIGLAHVGVTALMAVSEHLQHAEVSSENIFHAHIDGLVSLPGTPHADESSGCECRLCAERPGKYIGPKTTGHFGCYVKGQILQSPT